jgi:acyl-CoA synthetase (AMP-forming)/AMP-acid ligase II
MMTASTLVHHFLEQSALRDPAGIALVHEGRRASFREINAAANGVAAFLAAHGVSRGDRVPLLWENSCEFVAAYYGILKAGGVAVLMNPETKADGLKPIFADLRPAAVICSSRAAAASAASLPAGVRAVLTAAPAGAATFSGVKASVFEEVISCADVENPAAAVGPAQLANIIYTSGSTGVPKGVMLSHANLVANTRSICEYLKIGGQDIQMVVLPFFYVMGLSLLNTHIAAGGRVVINNRFAFAAAVLRQMADERVTAFSGVPSTYAFLLHRSPLREYAERLPHLRYCSQAGGHMPSAIKKDLRKALPRHTDIVVMYGATEASARLTWLEPARFEEKMGSIGRPIPGVSVHVLDANGNELGPQEEGELVAQGGNIMQGYWNDPESTAKVLDRHGYHTGDLGYRDADGFLFVTGRRDSIVKVGGHRVNPQEVEDALMETGLLVEAVVVPVPDDLLGSKLVALGNPHDSRLSPELILQKCCGLLPRHKLPARIVITGSLPKNANGKIDRKRCGELVPGTVKTK